MTRTKRRARRRVALSIHDDAEAEDEDEASDLMESYEIKDPGPLNSNEEIESFVEEFEEVDNVVSAVMEIDGNFKAPTEKDLAENSESGNLSNSSVDPSGSNRDAAEEELGPRFTGVGPEENSMNDESYAAKVKDMELNRCADYSVTTKDKDEGEGERVLERTRDDCDSDENSKDGAADEQASTSVENPESQINERGKFSLQVKTVYIEGPPKSWNMDKLKEVCEQFGEIKHIKISRNLNRKGKDFGFVAFTTREDALACVEGINERKFEGNLKIKAYIARPLTGRWLPRVTHGGFKRRHKPIAGWKITDNNRSEGSEDENDIEGQTQTVLPAHGAEEKAASLSEQTGHSLSNLLGTKESETKTCKSDNPHATEVRVPSRRRKNRKRKKRKRVEHTMASTKQKGNSQGQTNTSSRKSRSKSRLRKRQKSGAVSIPFGPNPKGYVASQNLFPVYVHNPVYRSNRVLSEMAPHAGYIKLHKGHDYSGWIVPAFGHRQLHAVNTGPVDHNGGQPHSGYQKTSLGNDALPHAGYLEPGVGKQWFDDHAVRRTGYNGLGNDGFAYPGRMW